MDAEADPALPFVHAQEKGLSQALARYLDNAGGRRALYRLPWYLVLGARQAGKSSFIDCTDQSFSLTRIDKAQARGRPAQALAYPVGWWISNDAVIIDPPGAFISQNGPVDSLSSGSSDAESSVPPGTQANLWQHLLDWLQRNRSQRALNGLVLVVDLPALLHGTVEQRTALAHLLRTRLYEVSSQLGSRLPLYVVLSKFDLLDGFDQFYSKLSAAKRNSLFGFTFKLDAVDTFDAWLGEYGEHYDRLLEQLFEQVIDQLDVPGTDLPQYRQRVSHVQQTLRKVPLPQRVYAGLKQQAQEQLHTGLDLRHQVGPAFDVVYQLSSGSSQGDNGVLLAPMLTAKGFKEYFEPRSQRFTEMAMIDQWVLGERAQLDYSDADQAALNERLRNLYSADYIDSWRRALNAFSVADFRDLDHGVTILEQLAGPAAPLHRLLETVRDNSSLLSPVNVGVADEAPSPVSVNSKPEQQQALVIQRAFAGLSAMLHAAGEKPSYYDETHAAIVAVHDYAKAVQGSPDRGKAALHAVHQRFSMTGHDPIGTLQRVATGLPEPINHHVRKVADQTAQVLNVEALRELERRWDAEVYSFFQQRLAERYPFVVRAPDASLEDFEAFFGPKGRLQQFQDQYLKLFLKDNLEALQDGLQGRSLIRTDVIEQLERADRIRETFFDQRGNLSVQFSIEPLGLSANQRTSLLDLDGQLISYTHGPSQITGIVWPNTLGQHVRSNLTLLRQNGNSSSLEYRGPWSMFRLLSRGALNGRTATSVDLSFKTGDGVMRYRLNAEKAFNPITQQPFKGFRLPRGLLQQPVRVALAEQADVPVM